MKQIKILMLTLIITGLFTFMAKPVKAEVFAGSSAVLSTFSFDSTIKEKSELEIKRTAIASVLSRYNAPLKDNVDSFINACTKYNLDCYMLPSISGVESTFGRFTYPGSNNPFGWGRGLIMFKDWDESIMTVGQGLRQNYMDKWNTQTIDEIGTIYCEGNTWSTKVKFFMNQFKTEEEKIRLNLSQDLVQL